jgi:hypothetical protein
LPVDLAQIGGVSAFHHQHKTRRTVKAVICVGNTWMGIWATASF